MGYRNYSYDEYLKAMDMYQRGLGPTEISRKLGILEKTVEGWIYHKKVPPLARWHPEPSNELAYVLGVLYGDGNITKCGYKHIITLEVKDLEFAEFFSKTVSKLLNKKYIAPKWDKSDNEWRVVYHSKAFYVWYKEQTLETLKPYIEHNKGYVASFLRGVYDSEGNHYKSKKKGTQIRLSNNNLKLLNYVQHLLKKYFDITATGPYLNGKAGEESKMGNRTIKRRHDNYRIEISRRQHTQRFLSEIGFNITEKQLGLPRSR